MHDVTRLMTSRASRRGLLKGSVALGLGGLGLGQFGGRQATAQDAGSLEVFS